MNPQLTSGIDATKKLPGEGFKRPWPPLIKMDAAVKTKMERLFKGLNT
jgi:4-hydroxy-3-polyprenylbenzoate decarboxylase